MKRSPVIEIRERWWLPTRIDGEEWLDYGHGTLEDINQSLADLSRINRWLGGMRGVGRHLYPRVRACRTALVRVLDLGAGGCAIPADCGMVGASGEHSTAHRGARPPPDASAVGAEAYTGMA